MAEKRQSYQRGFHLPKLKAVVLLLGLSTLFQLRKSHSNHGQYLSLSDDFYFLVQISQGTSIAPTENAGNKSRESIGRPKLSATDDIFLAPSNTTTGTPPILSLANTEEVSTRNLSLRKDSKKNIHVDDGALSSRPVDPVLQPIVDSGGMFYILNRRDRSGRVVADMIYAHAFAFANNLTFAGLCWIQGKHKHEVHALIKDLKWSKVLPFACPKGSHPKKFAKSYSPNQNATEISPLILNFDVFKVHSNFKRDWIRRISDDLSDHMKSAKGKKLRVHNESKPYEIVVQVRRGDIEPCKFAVRYLPNSHYLSLIDQYTPSKDELNGRSVHVTIFSESDSYEPFDEFIQRGYSVELDTPKLADVWRALATADVAILSRSFFSMVPAIVNPNTVVMTDYFQFGALDDWKVVHLSDEDENQISNMHDECMNKTKE